MVASSEGIALREAIELLYFGYRAFTAHPDRILKTQGLGRVHHRILYFIGRHPYITIHGLLKILGVSKQALHRPLRDLLVAGLVTERTALHDRRMRELTLSPQGLALETQLTMVQTDYLDAVFTAVGPEAEAAWRLVMQKMTELP